jgi:hypothetical protein
MLKYNDIGYPQAGNDRCKKNECQGVLDILTVHHNGKMRRDGSSGRRDV